PVRLPTIADILSGAIHMSTGRRGRVHAARCLQSWPEIVHGGGVVALLDTAAAALGVGAGPRAIEARLTSSLPLETDLELDTLPAADGVTLAVVQDAQTLASGTVRRLGEDALATPRWQGGDTGDALPTFDDCLACGARNALGLRASVRFDADGVWAPLVAPATWHQPDGDVHSALAPVLLDEIAWWLGALVAREGGVTNRITLALGARDERWDGPLVAAGRFADVLPVDRRRAFWRTESALVGSGGAVLATASIVFRGGPDYSARQLPHFRRRAPADL